jgi:hypothetical protein
VPLVKIIASALPFQARFLQRTTLAAHDLPL